VSRSWTGVLRHVYRKCAVVAHFAGNFHAWKCAGRRPGCESVQFLDSVLRHVSQSWVFYPQKHAEVARNPRFLGLLGVGTRFAGS
jgi:hypothetical protein